MIFTPTQLAGAYFIDVEPRNDDRGFFARSWCMNEFKNHDLNPNLAQCNIAYNIRRGTLRGLHYQAKPYEEAKLIRCTRGAIYDVIVDLRQNSPTLKKWLSIELTDENHRALYVPEGFAHGYQTLVNDTEIIYLVSEFYHPEVEHGIRWNDPAFSIQWPIADPIISIKDQAHPLWGSR